MNPTLHYGRYVDYMGRPVDRIPDAPEDYSCYEEIEKINKEETDDVPV